MAAKNKKSFMDDADPINDGYQKADAVRPTLEEIDREIYGGPPIADNGKQISRPIPLDAITPDPTQPRREVPATVRRKAKEAGLSEWLVWHGMAERQARREIPLKALLKGEGDAPESGTADQPDSQKTGDPIADSFLSLVALAAAINREGLTNAITVVNLGMDRYQIETGERRYQAYRLLHGVFQEERFAKIPARVESKSDVWKQASENGSRKPLNAIGMARQLALLIMDLYQGKDGADFVPFHKIVPEGGCDRVFYAQVADGNIWRIPKGQSERILQVTGLGSTSRLQQYRDLLNLPDEWWQKGDEEDLKEGGLRVYVPTRNPRHTSTIVDVSPQNRNPSPDSTRLKESHLVAPNAPLSWPLEGAGVRFMRYQGQRVQLESASLNDRGVLMARIHYLDPTTGTRKYATQARMSDLQDLDAAPTPSSPFGAPRQSLVTAPALAINAVYLGPQKKHYRVLVVTGSLVRCEEVSPVNGRRLAGPFSLNVSDLQPLPTSAETVPDFNAQAAREAIMGPDDDTEPEISAEEALAQMGRSAALAEEPTHAPLPHLTEREEELLLALFVGSSFVRDDMVRRTLLTHKLVKPVGDAPWQLEITGRGIDCLIDCGRAKRSHETADYAPIPPQDAFKPWREGQHVLVDHFAYRFEGHIRQVFASVGRVEVHLAGTKDHRQTVDTKYLRNLDPNWPAATEDTWEDDDTAPLTPMTAIDLRPLPFPEWAATGRLVRDIDRALTGMAQDARWDGRVWQVSVRFTDHTGDVPLDMLQPDDPTPILPAWAFTGGWVIHRDSGQTCEITAVVLNTQTVDWELKVLVLPAEGPAQAPLSDFTFSDETRPRHPALEASNRGGVVTTDQHLMGPLVEMARKLKMKEAESFAISTQTTTADGLAKRLRTGGELTTRAHLDAQREAALAIVAEITAAINRIYTADHQAVTDLVKELEAQHGAAR